MTMQRKWMTGWLTHAWKKEDKDQAIIVMQHRFIWIVLALCIFLGVGWMLSPRDITIHVPPDITNGATFKIHEVPAAFLHSFSYEVWQNVNDWVEDGTQDYPKNIRAYAAYLTPRFQTELLADYEDLKTAGQVQRQRSLQGMVGRAFESVTVKKLSADSWEIDLHMRLLEYRNNEVVKDIDMLYPLRVIRWDISSEKNPYGLAIDGFISAPTRLKTNV